MKKYYFYSVRLIIKKLEKYINNIKGAYTAINEVFKNIVYNPNSAYQKFLLEKLKLIKNDLVFYKVEYNQNINNNMVEIQVNITNVDIGIYMHFL